MLKPNDTVRYAGPTRSHGPVRGHLYRIRAIQYAFDGETPEKLQIGNLPDWFDVELCKPLKGPLRSSELSQQEQLELTRLVDVVADTAREHPRDELRAVAAALELTMAAVKAYDRK